MTQATHVGEITAADIENQFGTEVGAVRFANFCNAVLVAEASVAMTDFPILSEKRGPDGGFDAEWDVPPTAIGFFNPFADIGWNVFQYKVRSITGGGRDKAFSDLKSSLRGALAALIKRLKKSKQPVRYALVTNLQLGLETQSETRSQSILSAQRSELIAAILEDGPAQVQIEIIDAAQMAAIVNARPALRLTYFHGNSARTWSEKSDDESALKNYNVSVPFLGRETETLQLRTWLADNATKVIAIVAPSGMGKTRIALEATASDEVRTTFTDLPGQLIEAGIHHFAGAATSRIIVVDDPSERDAIVLAKQALAANGVKLLLTVPSEDGVPPLRLGDHPSLKQMLLQPLTRENARKLLELANPKLDGAARDWILQQAGGVPEIILAAAEPGTNLREKAGGLKQQLAANYRRRVIKQCGEAGIKVLRIISPLLWTRVSGRENNIKALIHTIGDGIDQGTIANALPSLEKSRHLRRRGDFASVVPPMFAAALTEELFNIDEAGMAKLYDLLAIDARHQMLERVISTDLPEDAGFWSHIFEQELRTTSDVINSLATVDHLARAIPARTARFIEKQIDELANAIGAEDYSSTRSTFHSILRELAYTAESCATGMRMLETLALREDGSVNALSAAKQFCECFVHWFIAFPLSFQKREQWVREMLASSDPKRRLLATHIVIMVTDPPQSLSGYAVNARRLGTAPSPRMRKEVRDYCTAFVNLRFELINDSDLNVAELAKKDFSHVFQRYELSPDENVEALAHLVQLQRSGKVNVEASELRRVIDWVETEYKQASQKEDQAPYADKWAQVLAKMSDLKREFDDGPFVLRLRLAIGHALRSDYDEVDGQRVYGYEQRCRNLALEAAANPELMTEAAWATFDEPQTPHAYIFLMELGAADRNGAFVPRLEQYLTDSQTCRRYACYLIGVQRTDSHAAEQQLDRLIQRQDYSKDHMLPFLFNTGPTAANRRRLSRLIDEKSVTPLAIGQMFTSGRWLDDLPPPEVRKIVDYIATNEASQGLVLVIEVLSLYLHDNRPLPPDIIPAAESALRGIQTLNDHIEWSCERVAIGIARSDADRAFSLLTDQIQASLPLKYRAGCTMWFPFDRYAHQEFWAFVRKLDPERAYRALLPLAKANLRSEIGLVLDMEKDRDTLLRVAKESDSTALFLASLASAVQPGYFQFAYELMDAFPENADLSSTLASNAIYHIGGISFDQTTFVKAHERVEAELASSATPPQWIGWLQDLKKAAYAAVKQDEQDHGGPYLGWD